MINKSPKANLRAYYTIFSQIGIICALLFLIAATNIRFEARDSDNKYIIVDHEFDPIFDIPITKEPRKPAPHKPSVLTEVPNDDPIEPDPITFIDFEHDEAIPLPEPVINTTVDEEIPIVVEIMPEMKGGLKKLYSEINYPEMARKAGIEGRVIVQFIINEQGEVESPTILRGIGGGCDEEVLRVIRKMSFTPGIQNGKFVKVRMSQPVKFELQN